MRRELRGLRLIGTVSAAALVAGCSGGGGNGPGPGKEQVQAPVVAIAPVDGSGKARPEQGVTVKATLGELTAVKVSLKGKEVPGALSEDKKVWRSTGNLVPNASYAVEAVAQNGDQSTTTTSSFKTLKPSADFGLESNIPWSGQTVGIGMPIVLNFSQPVKDKKAVEGALTVESEKPNTGAWYWYTDKQLIFRAKEYWEPYQDIKVNGRFTGVKAAKGVYGLKDFTIKFKVGSSNISKINTRTHRMTVAVDGKKVRDVGISAGKATERKYTTTSGIHLTMEKEDPAIMISPGIEKGEPGYYREVVPHAVRISYSGEYVHSAPWSVGSQGRANVSHGCVNAPPEFARWYYAQSKWGDIVDITGTDRELEFDNGYGYWQKPWKEWVLGSAFDQAVSTAAGQAESPGNAGSPAPSNPAESTTS